MNKESINKIASEIVKESKTNKKLNDYIENISKIKMGSFDWTEAKNALKWYKKNRRLNIYADSGQDDTYELIASPFSLSETSKLVKHLYNSIGKSFVGIEKFNPQILEDEIED